jgi:toxin HigB-1
MIRSCRDKEVQRLPERKSSRAWQVLERTARVRLALLDAATALGDLRLPGLRLEALKGDRDGQHSIRINDQFRICFEWRAGDAYNVEIADDHEETQKWV